MSNFLIMIIIISIIITTSKIIMRFLKQQDVKNGLDIKSEYYTIQKTLTSSNKQEKRLKKMQKMLFNEFEIDDKLWKQSYLLLIALSGIGVGINMITKISPGSVLLIVIFASIIYFQKSIKILICMDIMVFLFIISAKSVNTGLMVVLPLIILFNYAIWTDYYKYRQMLKS